MQLNNTANSWLDLLNQLQASESQLNCKKSIEHLYFSTDGPNQSEVEQEYASIREQIFISPKEVPRTVTEGMLPKDEKKVRMFAASMIRKVGVLLSIPIETVCIAQNIMHRFYYR